MFKPGAVRAFIILALAAGVLSTGLGLAAQCAMCTSTIELNAERNQQVGGAFNSSIAFMLLVPTLLVVGLGVRLYFRLCHESSLPNPE